MWVVSMSVGREVEVMGDIVRWLGLREIAYFLWFYGGRLVLSELGYMQAHFMCYCCTQFCHSNTRETVKQGWPGYFWLLEELKPPTSERLPCSIPVRVPDMQASKSENRELGSLWLCTELVLSLLKSQAWYNLLGNVFSLLPHRWNLSGPRLQSSIGGDVAGTALREKEVWRKAGSLKQDELGVGPGQVSQDFTVRHIQQSPPSSQAQGNQTHNSHRVAKIKNFLKWLRSTMKTVEKGTQQDWAFTCPVISHSPPQLLFAWVTGLWPPVPAGVRTEALLLIPRSSVKATWISSDLPSLPRSH